MTVKYLVSNIEINRREIDKGVIQGLINTRK